MLAPSGFKGLAVQRRPVPRQVAVSRRQPVAPQALFGGGGSRRGGRAQELVEELVKVSSRTSGGLNASSKVKQQIQELVRPAWPAGTAGASIHGMRSGMRGGGRPSP